MVESYLELNEIDSNEALLAAPELAGEIVHNPGGDLNLGVPIRAFVHRVREEGTNEVHGDGATPDSNRGRRVRVTYLVDIDNHVEITKRDTFIIDDKLFNFIRKIGRDTCRSAGMTIRVVRADGDFTRQSDLRPTSDTRYGPNN